MGQTERVLSVDSKNEISEALNQSVSELVVTTMMAQNFHWNVTGMAFGPLHELFQKIYEDHFEAQDELAERIKAIGGHANRRVLSTRPSQEDQRGGGSAGG